jgi:hypothetical protein
LFQFQSGTIKERQINKCPICYLSENKIIAMPKLVQPYDKDTEEYMVLFNENLTEKDRRHYAAVEAKKLGHGGIEYIARLFDLSVKTVARGLDELSKKSS